MRLLHLFLLLLVVSALKTSAGQAAADEPAVISSRQLPKALLWEPYRFRLEATGGTEPYHWRLVSGSLPHRFALNDRGELTGTALESGEYQFTVALSDSSRPAWEQRQRFVLTTETPLKADWQQRARTDGLRLAGSVKVSNRSGRDFDLTVIVLAVNESGRATAIGYQHFPLKRDTEDLGIPFGDTLAPGNYVVNVDVIGEEPVAKRIFRARLVTGAEQVTGP